MIKRIFQLNLNKKESVKLKRILALIMMPVFILQMSSLNPFFVQIAKAEDTGTTTVDSAPAPDPAPKAVEPKVETPKVETPAPDPTPPADPTSDPKPVIDPTPPTEPTPDPTPVADPAPVVDPAPTEETSGIIDPLAATTENLTPAIETPAEIPVPEVAPVADKECLADGADIKTSNADDWKVDGDTAKTKDNVKLGVKYEFPGDKDVSVTFTCLPTDSAKLSTLKIEQIKSSDISLPDGISAATDFAYDITTGMDNGDFKYDLTLPKSDITDASINYIEKTASEVTKEDLTKSDLKSIDDSKIKEEKDDVKVSELDHFTIFIITSLSTVAGGVNSVMATVNDQPQVMADPGATISAKVTVTTTGSGVADDWRSTRWRIDIGSWTCVNTADHDGDGTYTETFNITAPVAPDAYNVSFEAFNNAGCVNGSGGSSDDVTLIDGIIVSSIEITAATVDTLPQVTVAQGATISAGVTTETWGSGDGDNWESTQWRIGTGSWTCADTANHSAAGSFTETFNITAPSVPGTYDVSFRAFNNAGCAFSSGNGSSEIFTLTNGITVTGPDLSVVKTNNVSGTAIVNNPFIWTLTVTNNGAASVTFDNNQDILEDDFPTGLSYADSSNLAVVTAGSVTGTIDCDISSDTLDCDASGPIVFPVGGSFSVDVEITPSSVATLTNPRSGSGNICRVDPDVLKPESDETNNNCSDSVAVSQYSVTPNPSLSQACGLDIALVIDNSTSIDSGEMTQIKNAMTEFTGALNGTPTWFSVTKFATTASISQAFTSDINAVNSAINAIPVGGGYTNWQDGLTKAESTFDPRTTNPDLVIFASDGNPNRTGSSGTSVTEAQAVADAVLVANGIKTDGIRILALGVGSDLDTANMIAISGTNVDTGDVLTSDVITSDFSELAADLAEFASQTCGGTITVNKYYDSVDPNNRGGAGWQYNIAGTSKTTDIGGQTEAIHVSAGSNYSVTETNMLPGYSYGSASCKKSTGESVGSSIANGVGSITMGNNDIISCDFVNNTNKGSITIIKDAQPSDGQDFAFTTTGNELSSFILDDDDDTDATWSNTKIFNNLMPGSFSVTEEFAAGWDLDSITCTAGGTGDKINRIANITITPGANVTCTFTNKKQQGTLNVIKHVINDNGGTKDAGDFTINVTGSSPSPSSFLGSESGTAVTLNIGSYSVDEVAVAGYAKTLSGDCSGTITGGETKTCTITNNDIAPSLTLVKSVTNDNGGVLEASAWTLTASGPTGFSGPGPSVSSDASFDAGTYTLTELGPGGYDQSNWICVGTGTQTGSNAISLSLGQSATCTVANDDIAPSLTLVKHVTKDNGGTAVATDWTLTADGPTTISGAGGVASGAGFEAGTYVLSESDGPTGYAASEWSCVKNNGAPVNGSSITLGLSDTAICTITNDDIAPKLTLVKDPTNNSGGNAAPDDFQLTVGGSAVLSGIENTYSANTPYAINETQLTGYEFVSITGAGCPAQLGDTITLNEGDDITCTITNDDIASILTLVKTVVNDNGGNKDGGDWVLYADGSDGSFYNWGPIVGPNNVVAGVEYTLSETTDSDYQASSWVCTGGGTQVENKITLALGEDVTCTITNDDIAPTITLVKVVDNKGVGTATPSDWLLGISYVAFGQGPTLGPVTVSAGTDYIISEAPGGPTGYTASTWSCDNGITPINNPTNAVINLPLAKNVTCTITNTRDTGSINVHKLVDADGNGSYEINTDAGANALGFNWNLDNVGANAFGTEVNNVGTGSHNVNENSVSGYHPVGWYRNTNAEASCANPDSPSLPASVDVFSDTTTEITICNAIDTGHLIVQKTTIPSGDPTIFNVYAAGTGTIFGDANGSVTDSSDKDYLITPGTYSVVETGLDDWAVTGNTCTDVAIGAGETKTCEITNTKRGSITIVKDSSPDNPQDFRFTGSGPGVDTSLDLDDDSDPTISNSWNIGGTLPGTYTFSEGAVEGWDLTDISCTGASDYTPNTDARNIVINLQAGENATCTFTNTHSMKIFASKIICNDEADLPNWGLGGPDITATTAEDWVANHSSCRLETDWQFQWSIDGIGNPGDDIELAGSGWNTFDTTGVEITSPATSRLWFREALKPDYIPFSYNDATGNSNNVTAEFYCNNDVLNYDNWEWIDTAPGQNYYCVAWNVQLSDVHGFKWNDLDGDGTMNGDETKLSGWEIFIDENDNLTWDDGEPKTTTSADPDPQHLGWYWFENLTPGQYKICEVQQDGWEQTYPTDPVCHIVNLPRDCSQQQGLETVSAFNYVETYCQFDFGNQFVVPELKIDKFVGSEGNYSLAGQHPGDTVHYILKIKAAGGDNGEIENQSNVNDVVVTDLPPKGFVYQSGSDTATSSLGGAHIGALGLTSAYASPGTWDLGDMQPGEIITLAYDATISGDQDAGTYPDLAWAVGTDLLGNTVQATKGDPELFAGTQVAVAVPGSPQNVELENDTKRETKTRERVLGVTTFLPATGSSTWWIILAVFLAVIGGGLIFLGRRKKIKANSSIDTVMKIFILALCGLSFIGLSGMAKASGPDPNISVQIETPKSPSDTGIFKIGFVALDIQGRNLTVKCFKAPSDVIPDDFVVHAGGNSGNCLVNLPDGTYNFFVEAYDPSNSSNFGQSGTVTVEINTGVPGTPLNYDRDGDSCNLTFTTANDGLTSKVELYRSIHDTFTADASTFATEVAIGPNLPGSLTDPLGNCGDYFYAIRAVSAAGIGSDFVGDEDINVETTTNTTTTTNETIIRTGGAIPVTGGGAVAGENVGGTEEGGTQTEQGVQGAESEAGQVAGEGLFSGNGKYWLLGILAALGLIYYAYRRSKRKSKQPIE